jgi:integrase
VKKMADQRKRAIKGRLYKRDAAGNELPAKSKKHGVYWLQYTVRGERVREKLLDPDTGEDVTDQDAAELIRKTKIAPFTTGETTERLKTLRAAVTGAEERHAEAVELVRDKLALADTWDRYLAAQNRPDSGESTLRQYRFQWDAFVAWMKSQHPDLPALHQVTATMAGDYAGHLQKEGLGAGTINKHVRLLRLVFRILGPREKIATNPFDDINSKHEVQTHRQELSWDVLCRVCDAAVGEMKLLLFLGIYTGQRLADCCLLAWDQVDFMRGWILINPRKTARRTGKPLHIPIHRALRSMLETIPSERRTGFVLPELAGHYQANRDRVTDRIQDLFFRCDVQIHKAGTGRQRDPQTGKGIHTGKRAVLQYGFHSLRHTTVTLLQEAGVAQAVVQEIVGHRTVAMTQRYTHIGREALQKAVAMLPAAAPTARPAAVVAPPPMTAEQEARQRLHTLADSLPAADVHRVLNWIDAQQNQ